MNPNYSILIEWSENDQAFVVILPEWDGRYLMPVADGATYAEAFQRGMNALEHLIEDAQQHGEALPEPKTFTAA